MQYRLLSTLSHVQCKPSRTTFIVSKPALHLQHALQFCISAFLNQLEGTTSGTDCPLVMYHMSFGCRKRHLNLMTLMPQWRLMMVRPRNVLTSTSQPCRTHVQKHANMSLGNCLYSHTLARACFLLSIFRCTHLAIKAFLNHQLIAADFKQALGQQSSTGPAPPSKLTTHQMQIVKALIEAHGDDVEVPSQGLFLEAWCLQHPLAASNSLTIPFACD